MKRNILNAVIIATVLTGTVFLGSFAGIGGDGEVVSTLFLCFFATIIAIQVVPALMLFGFLLKEIFRAARRTEKSGARAGEGS